MKSNRSRSLICTVIVFLLSACGGTTIPPAPANILTAVPPASTLPVTVTSTSLPLPMVSIMLGDQNASNGISLDQGGDVDTQVVSVGNPAHSARSSGNGAALPATDGNSTSDSYIQFNVDDKQLFNGAPTAHVEIAVTYFDQGTDTFSLQYDGQSGTFAGGGSIVKTDSMTFKTATFNVCDAKFANRDNGADFRIADNGDGADVIQSVQATGLPSGKATVKVDNFGANPFDDQPDSEAIQSVLDSTCSGDTVVLTSGVNDPTYKGYLIDKTLFLTGMSAKHNLTFTSSDPTDHALLRASADLKGYVVRLYARSRFGNAGAIDNIDFGYIDVDGNRNERVCLGPDQTEDGNGDNWGSWLPECSSPGDPWCSVGNIGLDGGSDWNDTTQNYQAHPDSWTTGIVIHDVVDKQAECGSALAFFSAAGTIQNVTIDTAGDHVHESGCAFTDNDGDQGGWSDGITLFGPGQTVRDNTIINPSDVGIVFFGGKDTVISNNTVKVTAGNNGAFAAIAVHPWILGDISGMQIVGNYVSSEGDAKCGGIHAGINLGPQMWGGACVAASTSALFGNNNSCSQHPNQDEVAACAGGKCQLWAYLPAGSNFTLKDNTVSGAQVNYLIDGFDIQGTFVDQNNVSLSPQLSDWHAARYGCNGITWGAFDKIASNPTLPGYTNLLIQCER